MRLIPPTGLQVPERAETKSYPMHSVQIVGTPYFEQMHL